MKESGPDRSDRDPLPSKQLRSDTRPSSGSGRTPDPRRPCPTRRTNTPHRSGADRSGPRSEDSWDLPGEMQAWDVIDHFAPLLEQLFRIKSRLLMNILKLLTEAG